MPTRERSTPTSACVVIVRWIERPPACKKWLWTTQARLAPNRLAGVARNIRETLSPGTAHRRASENSPAAAGYWPLLRQKNSAGQTQGIITK